MADVVMNPSFPEDAFLREKESFVADAEAVSYTHLDVYKRQPFFHDGIEFRKRHVHSQKTHFP